MNIENDLNYICSYIKYAFFAVSEFEDNKFLIEISRKTKNSMPNSNFSTGNFDFIINNYVHKEMTLRNSKSYLDFSKVRNHIYLVISYYRVNVNPNLDNYQFIINELTRYAYNNFDLKDLMEGKCDEALENMIPRLRDNFKPSRVDLYLDFSKIGIDSNSYATSYIKSYLEKFKDIYDYNGDLKYLSSLIFEELIKINAKNDDLLAHYYDEFIDSFIKEEKFGIKLKNNIKLMQIEVSKYVMNNHTYMDENNVSKEIFVLSRDLILNGYSINDVTMGKCNEFMEKHLRLDCIKRNSKVNSSSNKVELKKKRIFQSDKFKAGILAFTLSIIAAGGNIALAQEKSEEFNFSDYDFPTIKYEMGNEYESTLEYIINNYDTYSEYGNYGEIYLYKAYQSMKGEPYNMMDSMLSLIRERAKIRDDMYNIINDIEGYESYISFVYAHLGNPKYEKAVKLYNSQVANYKELNSYRLLDNDTQSLLNEMMREYGKYIESLENELANNINESRSK